MSSKNMRPWQGAMGAVQRLEDPTEESERGGTPKSDKRRPGYGGHPVIVQIPNATGCSRGVSELESTLECRTLSFECGEKCCEVREALLIEVHTESGTCGFECTDGVLRRLLVSGTRWLT